MPDVIITQRAHITKASMSVLEKDDYDDVLAVEKAKRDEEDRIAEEEKLYEVQEVLTGWTGHCYVLCFH